MIDTILKAFDSGYFLCGLCIGALCVWRILDKEGKGKRLTAFEKKICDKLYSDFKSGLLVSPIEKPIYLENKQIKACDLWYMLAKWIGEKYLSYDYAFNESEQIHKMINVLFSNSSAEKLIAFDTVLNRSTKLYLAADKQMISLEDRKRNDHAYLDCVNRLYKLIKEVYSASYEDFYDYQSSRDKHRAQGKT